ncbi:hypothetical protein PVAP13_1KG116377 [Panicum virgatum]|uniref:Uncharacterized protein n=1 Tax=Panicum virgatum TaxID=38727 RepID=A0A8T0XE42_PANVG|nr:hypothetical protein PVAP13_1KG116377 [Panicum virgatum]
MRAALMQEYEDEDKQPPLQTAGASDLVALQSEAGSSSRAVGMTGSRPSVMGVLSAVPSPTLTGESCRVAAAANPQSAVSVLGKRSGPSGSASRGRSFKRPRSASCRGAGDWLVAAGAQEVPRRTASVCGGRLLVLGGGAFERLRVGGVGRPARQNFC